MQIVLFFLRKVLRVEYAVEEFEGGFHCQSCLFDRNFIFQSYGPIWVLGPRLRGDRAPST